MAYRSRSRRRTTRSNYRARGPKRRSRRATARRRSTGNTLRLVIEQPAANPVSRWPFVAAKVNPPPKKAKF
jgi:hypothetical protein